jgi:hypothetical protein
LDRCDTPAYWFILRDGVPYFACPAEPEYNLLIKQHTRSARSLGDLIERREGNYARATLDELNVAWPGTPRRGQGDLLLVEPSEVVS